MASGDAGSQGLEAARRRGVSRFRAWVLWVVVGVLLIYAVLVSWRGSAERSKGNLHFSDAEIPVTATILDAASDREIATVEVPPGKRAPKRSSGPIVVTGQPKDRSNGRRRGSGLAAPPQTVVADPWWGGPWWGGMQPGAQISLPAGLYRVQVTAPGRLRRTLLVDVIARDSGDLNPTPRDPDCWDSIPVEPDDTYTVLDQEGHFDLILAEQRFHSRSIRRIDGRTGKQVFFADIGERSRDYLGGNLATEAWDLDLGSLVIPPPDLNQDGTSDLVLRLGSHPDSDVGAFDGQTGDVLWVAPAMTAARSIGKGLADLVVESERSIAVLSGLDGRPLRTLAKDGDFLGYAHWGDRWMVAFKDRSGTVRLLDPLSGNQVTTSPIRCEGTFTSYFSDIDRDGFDDMVFGELITNFRHQRTWISGVLEPTQRGSWPQPSWSRRKASVRQGKSYASSAVANAASELRRTDRTVASWYLHFVRS